MKIIPVDVRLLEAAFDLDLHKFEPGETYPMHDLMNKLPFLSLRMQGDIK